jgi:NarL family two-component system response regulator LiaR
MPADKKITILLVDNQPATISGLRILFSKTKDIQLLHIAPSGHDAFSAISKFKPTLLVLDIDVNGPKPIELIKWIHENHKKTRVLIFTAIDDAETIHQMIKTGVYGYISKTESEDMLINSIRRVANGEIIFNQEQVAKVNQWRKEIGEKIDSLTHAENEILRLLVQGYGNQHIGKALNISKKTVAFHLGNIFKKLEVNSRHAAAVWAIKNLSDNLE